MSRSKICLKCGGVDWKWTCIDGWMEGECMKCGAKSNKFRARTGKVLSKKNPNAIGIKIKEDRGEIVKVEKLNGELIEKMERQENKNEPAT